MKTIIIDGKTYQLIPIETDDAAKKADYYRDKYSDYKNISREELINRIKKIDQMSEWEYCKYSMEKWVDWEKLYNAVLTQINCPYKSLAQFRQAGLDLVKEVFERKTSIATGYFEVKYYDGYEDDNHEWCYPEITLNVIFYGTTHILDNIERDYLTPKDD